MNAGSPEDNAHVTASKPLHQHAGLEKPTVSPAQLRHQYVQTLSKEAFQHLVQRIGVAHAKVSAAIYSKSPFSFIPFDFSLTSWCFHATFLASTCLYAGMLRTQAFAVFGTRSMSGILTT